VGQVTRYRTTAETWMAIPGMTDAASPDTSPTLRVVSVSTATVAAASGDTITFVLHRDSTDFQSPSMPQMAEMARASLAGQPPTDTVRLDGRGHLIGDGAYLPAGRFVLPFEAVRPGATWRDSSTTDGGAQGMQLTAVTDYRLERVEQQAGSRIAVISVRQSQTGGNDQAQVSQTTTLELRFDLTASRMLGAAGETNGDVVSVMGSMPIRARMRVEAF
jgi:hypothetical protein